MPAESDLILGDYRLQSTDSIILESGGQGILIRASDQSGGLVFDSATTTTVIAGPAVLTLVNASPTQGSIRMTGGLEGSITQSVGPPVVGPQIKIEPDAITLSIGPPGVGASIKLTPVEIALQVAQVKLSLTPTGISEEVVEVTTRKATPTGHEFAAAETQFKVQVQGITESGPLKQEKFEACATGKQTLAEESTDAMRSIKAGILTIG